MGYTSLPLQSFYFIYLFMPLLSRFKHNTKQILVKLDISLVRNWTFQAPAVCPTDQYWALIHSSISNPLRFDRSLPDNVE
jgi:hypothetical protein